MVKPESEKQTDRNEQNQPKYKGVRKRKWGKWVSEIRLPNSRERIWLGSYDSPEKAARAFDAALFCLRGSTATFNFPDNPPPPEISGGGRLTHAEIQAAAARFANSEPLTAHSDHSSSSSAAEGTSMVDQFSAMGSENHIFPGFDDLSLSNEYFVPPLPSADYGEENYDGVFPQDSYLWNF